MHGERHPTAWTVALSEELRSDKPLGVTCAGHAVALWRQPDGTPRAVEDRCPHRRVPLSLGCIVPDGRIRCGYHGWTYDGSTGHLEEIPNLPDQKRFPPVYRVRTYPVTEADGLVRVDLEAAPADPVVSGDKPALTIGGRVAVAMNHGEYIRAFLDAPELLITIPGVEFTKYLGADPHSERGRIVMERSCRWRGLRWPARVSADFELNLWSATDPATGETELKLMDRDFRPIMTAILAPVPAIRDTTAICWRAQSFAHGVYRLRTRRAPILVHDSIDAARLAAILPSASLEFDRSPEDAAPALQIAV